VCVACPAAGCGVVSFVEAEEGVSGLPVAPADDQADKPAEAKQAAPINCVNDCGRDAVCECADCGKSGSPYFCEECFGDVHRIAAFRKHVRASIGAAASNAHTAASDATPTNCGAHPDQRLLLACLHAGCRCLLCPVCSHDPAHKAHFADVLPLEHAAQRVQREVASASAALGPLLSRMEALAAELSGRLSSLGGEVSAAEASIKASFRALIERVEAQRDELLQRLRSSLVVLRVQAEGASALAARGRALVSSAASTIGSSTAAPSGPPPVSVESVARHLRTEASLRAVASVAERVSVSGADIAAASFRLDVSAAAAQVSSLTHLVVPEPLGGWPRQRRDTV
jgi:hypothetical protein